MRFFVTQAPRVVSRSNQLSLSNQSQVQTLKTIKNKHKNHLKLYKPRKNT